MQAKDSGMDHFTLFLPRGIGAGAQGKPGVKAPQHGGRGFHVRSVGWTSGTALIHLLIFFCISRFLIKPPVQPFMCAAFYMARQAPRSARLLT